jgi:hypothetical protein
MLFFKMPNKPKILWMKNLKRRIKNEKLENER